MGSNPNRLFRASLACGLGPLLLGTSIFLLYLLVRWRWLVAAGIATIFGGVLSFGFGVVFLILYVGEVIQSRSDSKFRCLVWSTIALAGYTSKAAMSSPDPPVTKRA